MALLIRKACDYVRLNKEPRQPYLQTYEDSAGTDADNVAEDVLHIRRVVRQEVVGYLLEDAEHEGEKNCPGRSDNPCEEDYEESARKEVKEASLRSEPPHESGEEISNCCHNVKYLRLFFVFFAGDYLETLL